MRWPQSRRGISQRPDLSDRESEVLRWLAKGCLSKEVAKRLSISSATVPPIYRKLRVRSKTAAASKVRR
jgi:DNA-binding CsgD family transcriptional regulator